jgi:hypothetical protein
LEVLICPVITGDRGIYVSTATSLVNPALTRAEGKLDISYNTMLARIDFASLSFVGGLLGIIDNPALTLASLPRLSQVQGRIFICQNAHSFVIPNPMDGTAAAPGLTSVEYKDSTTDMCLLSQGPGACGPPVTCP